MMSHRLPKILWISFALVSVVELILVSLGMGRCSSLPNLFHITNITMLCAKCFWDLTLLSSLTSQAKWHRKSSIKQIWFISEAAVKFLVGPLCHFFLNVFSFRLNWELVCISLRTFSVTAVQNAILIFRCLSSADLWLPSSYYYYFLMTI